MTKASIWGANGYIAQHLIRILIAKDWDLICYDKQDHLKGNFELPYKQIDISNNNDLDTIESYNEDYIFYFIGLTGTLGSIHNYNAFIKVNEIGILNLLNRIKDLPTKPHFVFPSSRLVYKGQKDQPLKESDEKEFKTVYASSKYNGELYLNMYQKIYSVNHTIFRIGVPYGNLMNESYSYGTIGFFLSQAMKGLNINLYGDGSLKRTFTHVEDTCSQIVEAVLNKDARNECFNILGETFSLKEIAQLIALKHNVSCEYKDWPKEALILESGDTIFNSNKIKKIIPNKLKHSFVDWIEN